MQEAQGFIRTTSNSRLVYDYKGCSQGSNTDTEKSSDECTSYNEKLTEVDSTPLPKVISSTSKFGGNKIEGKSINDKKGFSPSRSPTKTSHASIINRNNRTPESKAQSMSSSTSSDSITTPIPNSSLTSKFGSSSSPKSPIQSPGSVLSKASMFESKVTEPKRKDPAEMTLSERMALFERNRGEPPLIPKAPLSMSVSKKQLEEKEIQKTSSHHYEGTYNLFRVQILFASHSDKISNYLETHIFRSFSLEISIKQSRAIKQKSDRAACPFRKRNPDPGIGKRYSTEFTKRETAGT